MDPCIAISGVGNVRQLTSTSSADGVVEVTAVLSAVLIGANTVNWDAMGSSAVAAVLTTSPDGSSCKTPACMLSCSSLPPKKKNFAVEWVSFKSTRQVRITGNSATRAKAPNA